MWGHGPLSLTAQVWPSILPAREWALNRKGEKPLAGTRVIWVCL